MVAGMNDDKVGEFDQRGRPAVEALLDMGATLSRAGLVCPLVPSALLGGLAVSGESVGWAWGTSNLFRSFDVYWWPQETIHGLVDRDTPDLFLFGQRGHGANSYGLGLVARYGPVAVIQQTGWGGVYMDADQSTAAANAAVSSWARLVSEVDDLIAEGVARHDKLRYAVVYSDYRAVAQVLKRSKRAPVGPGRPQGSPDGWRVVADMNQSDPDVELRKLARVADRESVGGAVARHLLRLVGAEGR